MKILLYLFPLVLLISCETKESVSEDRGVGFWTAEPDYKWHLGTDEAIEIVKSLDKVWASKDFEGMKPFFVDTARFYFNDGAVANNPDEFVEILKQQSEGVEDSWTFDYAFSVDLDPSLGGEHVQAGFTGTSVKDSVETKRHFHESYYIIDGKIVSWNQHAMTIKDEE